MALCGLVLYAHNLDDTVCRLSAADTGLWDGVNGLSPSLDEHHPWSHAVTPGRLATDDETIHTAATSMIRYSLASSHQLCILLALLRDTC
eukprot:4992440-Amphidinium_carterae.1